LGLAGALSLAEVVLVSVVDAISDLANTIRVSSGVTFEGQHDGGMLPLDHQGGHGVSRPAHEMPWAPG
jgi:hypothetical protein